MDYIFFAFSSLCLSFAALLVMQLAHRSDRPLRWPYLLAAVLLALLYYAMLVAIARDNLTTYYILNILPQLSLVLLIFVAVKKYKQKR